MGNNPISKSDPLGETLNNKNDKHVAKEVRGAIKNTKTAVQKKNEKSVNTIMNAVMGGKVTQKDYDKALANANKNFVTIKQLNKSEENLNKIEADQNHGYTFSPSYANGVGRTSFNEEGINIQALNRFSRDSLVVHFRFQF